VNRCAALADAAPVSFWLDDPADPRPTPPLAGAIGTRSRFCAFFDLSFDGRVVSAAGHTGLGRQRSAA
jgi:hypothetical protein